MSAWWDAGAAFFGRAGATMDLSRRRQLSRSPLCGGDNGTAILECALVGVLLLTRVSGIMNFGVILSFKQDMTRAAAEGARAGAVSFPSGSAQTDARAATDTAV